MNEKECLKYMEEEFVNGAKAMLHYIQDEGTGCDRQDNCVICKAGNKFLEMKRKALVDNFPNLEQDAPKDKRLLQGKDMLAKVYSDEDQIKKEIDKDYDN